MTHDHVPIWQQKLDQLQQRDLRRQLVRVDSPQGPLIERDGRRLSCFASNNYLGLANHPRVVEAVRLAVSQWGWGAGASRLISGHMLPHEQLEKQLARFKRTEATLLCPTGYQANLAAVRALVQRQDVIFMDKLCHASLIDAARGSEAVVRVFGHRDYDRLESLLARKADAPRRLILTDSVFSMDGDVADLRTLVALKKKYDAMLLIDEAHATGVLGPGGRGLAEEMGVEEDIDVTVGTLSKALGGIGGFIAGSRSLIDWIVNAARPFIYTTALPPAVCAAAGAALEIIDQEPQRREKLRFLAGYLTNELNKYGYDTCGTSTPIIPVIVGDNSTVLELADALLEEGLYVPAVRPPTVPRGKARLRISLCAEHEQADLDRLIDALKRRHPPA